MNKRIEGTFKEYGSLLAAIDELKADGYEPEQLLVITRNEIAAGLTERTGVEVVVTRGESLWDRIVSFFTVDMDGEDDRLEDEEHVFEDYGIDEETYERFEDSLEDGEYLLLVDTAPPAEADVHADFMVRDGIIKVDDKDKMLAARPDWADETAEVDGDVPRHSRALEARETNGMAMAEFTHDEVDVPDEDNTGLAEVPVRESEHPDQADDITGEPIVVDAEPGDVTEGDEDMALDEMQYDEVDYPDEDRISQDPFGGETETKEQKE